MEKKRYITIVSTQDHKTCIKLTRNGEAKCKQDLESLQNLAKYFHSHHGIQDKHSETEQNKDDRLSKGLKPKSNKFIDVDIMVDNLINSIWNWK